MDECTEAVKQSPTLMFSSSAADLWLSAGGKAVIIGSLSAAVPGDKGSLASLDSVREGRQDPGDCVSFRVTQRGWSSERSASSCSCICRGCRAAWLDQQAGLVSAEVHTFI